MLKTFLMKNIKLNDETFTLFPLFTSSTARREKEPFSILIKFQEKVNVRIDLSELLGHQLNTL